MRREAVVWFASWSPSDESAKWWGARDWVGRWPPARPATSPPPRAMVSIAEAVSASPAIPASGTSPTPGSLHIRTGLHRLTGETTNPIERSHIATRDRLRASPGLKTTATGQRFLEGFEVVQALRRGDVALCCLVPGYRPQLATRGDHARAVAAAMATLAAGLNKAA